MSLSLNQDYDNTDIYYKYLNYIDYYTYLNDKYLNNIEIKSIKNEY